jgi:hypothetical protein
MNSSLELLDKVHLNFSDSNLVFLNIALAFVMFGVALDIKVEHFRAILHNPKSAVMGFISQTFLLPAFTFLLVLVLNPTPTVALGMILVAACPGGNISNFISSMARANVALSVSLTALSTSAAIFFTPFNFALWGNLYVDFYNATSSSGLVRPLVIDKYQMFEKADQQGLPGLFCIHGLCNAFCQLGTVQEQYPSCICHRSVAQRTCTVNGIFFQYRYEIAHDGQANNFHRNRHPEFRSGACPDVQSENFSPGDGIGRNGCNSRMVGNLAYYQWIGDCLVLVEETFNKKI